VTVATTPPHIRVLLVEDNPGDARLILELLREVHADTFDLERVDRLEPALTRLGQAGIDVVLLDLGLPDSSGLETFHRARAGGGGEPIIVISGLDDETIALEAVRGGAQDYLVKGRIEGQLLARVIHYAIERKRVEKQLRASESRLAAIVQAALDAHVTMDDTGTIVTWNPQAQAVFGWPPQDVIGRHVADVLVPAAHREAHWRGLRAFLAGGEGAIFGRRLELPALRRDGSEFPIELAVAPIRLGDSWIFSAFMRDISEQKETDKVQQAVYGIAQAAQTAASLQDLLRAVHETTATLMPAKNFYIALYDEAADLLTFPYFVDEVDPPPPPRQPGAGLTEQVLRTGTALLSKEELGLAQGEVPGIGAPSVDWLGVPLRQGDRTIGVIAVQTYTTGVRYGEREKEILQFVATQVAAAIERKHADDALRHSEERFRALVEHSGDAIALLDRTGTIVFAGQSTALVLGREPSEVVGNNVFGLLHPDDLPELRAALATLKDQPGRSLIVRSRFRHADDTWRDGEGTVTNRLHDPAVRALVFNYRDVTERTRLETQFRQAQKMEAVGRLAGGVAHDFNNLLTAIFGYADLLAESLPPDHPGLEDLGEIRTAATRAAGLTRQLLAFSRQQVLRPVVLSVNDVVENVQKMLGRLLGEDIELHASLAGDLGNVRADAGQLDQVIINLAVNARDAMPKGGKLTLETANIDLDTGYAEQHQPVAPGRYVMLAVSDTGTGMDEKTKAKAFEPFFTTKEPGKGTGLGLATVYGIVKQSGGYIWAYSELGQGTTFKIYLPRVDAPSDTPVAVPELTGTPAGTETVLLAEDDPLLLPLARDLLKKLGYRVLEAHNSAEALTVARNHEGVIHLLLSDVVMPGGGGFQLAQNLLVERPAMRVLYMSGYTDEAVVRHGLLERGLNYLQKPFTPAVLARRVRGVLDAS